MEKMEMVKHRPKSYRWKFALFFVFFVIIAFLIYTAFSGNVPFTGSAVGPKLVNGTLEDGIEIIATLDVPEMEIKGKFSNIKIQGGSTNLFYVGNEKFDLGGSGSSYIVLQYFNGDIGLDSDGNLILNGKTEEASINGVGVLHKSDKMMKVKTDENLVFNSLEIQDGIGIRKLSYVTSGVIRISGNKEVFQVENELITLKDYVGSLTIEGNKMYLDGHIRGFELGRKSRISVGG